MSIILGLSVETRDYWLKSTTVLVAIFLVSNISAANDYSKELQFRALESTSQRDELVSVLRDGNLQQIKSTELVVGDIILLQPGDCVPADCIIIEKKVLFCNESALTGEPEDVMKCYMEESDTISIEVDCFLLSSSLVSGGEETKAVVIAVGQNSQWGALKASLTSIEPTLTPLQTKLAAMSQQIGIVGVIVGIACFIGLSVKASKVDYGYEGAK